MLFAFLLGESADIGCGSTFFIELYRLFLFRFKPSINTLTSHRCLVEAEGPRAAFWLSPRLRRRFVSWSFSGASLGDSSYTRDAPSPLRMCPSSLQWYHLSRHRQNCHHGRPGAAFKAVWANTAVTDVTATTVVTDQTCCQRPKRQSPAG